LSFVFISLLIGVFAYYLKYKESVFTKININSASEKKLVLLPGIGVKTAQKIIEYRETKGKFHTPNELLKVSGIGEKKIKKIKNLIIIE
jgi:competence protein ComEA